MFVSGSNPRLGRDIWPRAFLIGPPFSTFVHGVTSFANPVRDNPTLVNLEDSAVNPLTMQHDQIVLGPKKKRWLPILFVFPKGVYSIERWISAKSLATGCNQIQIEALLTDKAVSLFYLPRPP